MQNDATNNYSLLNGYDKPNASYTFQSPNTGAMLRNNVTKIQMKNVGSNKNTPRVSRYYLFFDIHLTILTN